MLPLIARILHRLVVIRTDLPYGASLAMSLRVTYIQQHQNHYHYHSILVYHTWSIQCPGAGACGQTSFISMFIKKFLCFQKNFSLLAHWHLFAFDCSRAKKSDSKLLDWPRYRVPKKNRDPQFWALWDLQDLFSLNYSNQLSLILYMGILICLRNPF